MAQVVKLKRSSQAGKVPTTADLALGELAINTSDGKLYFSKDDGSESVQSLLATNTNAPVSGALSLSGSIHLTGSMFMADGSMGIGTNTPVARLEIEDDGTINTMLLKLTSDDTNVYGMVVGNDTFSTTDTDGGQHILSNDGTYIIRSVGSSTAARIGAGTAWNNYKYLEIDYDSDTAEFTTTNISGSVTSTGSFGSVHTAGNVGIGTTSPSVPLHVLTTETDLVKFESSNNSGTNVYILNSDATIGRTANLYLGPANNVAGAFIRSTAIEDFSSNANRTADMSFHTRKDGTFAQQMTIDEDGNVGIGATAPSKKLHVVDGAGSEPTYLNNTVAIFQANNNTTTNARIAILGGASANSTLSFANASDDNPGSIFYNHSADSLNFRVNTGTRMFIKSDGNVGIGTTAPPKTLTVQGDISGSGTLNIDGNATFSGAATFSGDVSVGTSNSNSSADLSVNAGIAPDISHAGGGLLYEPLENGSYSSRWCLRFDYTNNASFPFLTNRTPSGAVVIKTGTALGGDENEHFRIKGGDGTVDAYFTNANVGIGTTSPTDNLDIVGDLLIGSDHAEGTGRTDNTRKSGDISLYHYSNEEQKLLMMRGDIQNDTAGSLFIGGGSSLFNAFEGIIFYTGASNVVTGTERMRIDSSGNVGIGTTSPAAKLDVAIPNSGGTAKQEVQRWLQTSQNTLMLNMYGGATDLVQLAAVNGEQNISIVTEAAASVSASTNKGIYIQSGGNVGIGTTSPGAKLEVIGDISGSSTSTGSFGSMYVDGNATIGGRITAQEFHTEFVSASIVYESGSTKFGDTIDDRHEFSGSLYVSGSQEITDGIKIFGSDPTTNYMEFTAPGSWNVVGSRAVVKIGGSEKARFYSNGLNIGGGTDPTHTLDVDGTANISGATTFSSTISAASIGTDTGNTVVILNGSGYLKTDEIDSRVWGSTLLDGTNGTDNEIAIFTDSNSVEGDANLTFDGSTLEVAGNISGSSTSTGSFGAGYIDNKLGIGTTTPGWKLQLEGAGAWNNADSPSLALENTDYSTTNHWRINVTPSGEFQILESDGSTRLLFNYDGVGYISTSTYNFGFGVSTPSASVHILDTSEQLRLAYDADSYTTFTAANGGHFTLQTGEGAAGDLSLKAAGSFFADFDTDGASAGEVFRVRANQGSGLVNLVTVQRDGDVGIGITNPGVKLHLNESTDNSAILRIDSGETIDNTLATALDLFAGSSTATANKKNFRIGNLNDANSAGQNQIVFQSRNDDGSYKGTLMVIESDGNVGIGTTSPGSLLDIVGGDVHIDATQKIYLDGGSDTYIYENSANDLRIIAGGNTAFDFLSTGAGVSTTKNLYLDGGGNTYFQESSADNIRAVAGGTAILDITSTSISGSSASTGSFGYGYYADKVGIGTTNPLEKLHINNGKLRINDDILIYEAASSGFANLSYNSSVGRLEISRPLYVTGTGTDNYFAGNVGIGTNTIEAKVLHIKEGDSGASVSGDATVFIEDASACVLEIGTGTSGFGAIYFGDSGGSSMGKIKYDHNGDYMVFNTAEAESFRISGGANGVISGSSTSTASFGAYIGDGSQLTDVTSTPGAAGSIYNVQYNSDGSATAGSDNFVFKSGDVGIGTTSPQEKLHVVGPGSAFNLEVETESSGYNGIKITNTEGSFAWYTDGGRLTAWDALASADIMTISGSRVGIGTTGPAGKLSVTTTSDTSGTPTAYNDKYFIVGAGGTTGGNVFISYDQTNNRGYIGALSPSVAWRDLILQPGGGKVGIGTTSPDYKLHVAGSTGIGVRSTGVDGTFADILTGVYSGNANEQNAIQTSVSSVDDSSGFNFLVSEGGGSATQHQAYRMTKATHRFYVAGVEKMRVHSDGNVGIGTASPAETLHVEGSASFAGDVTVSGSITAQNYIVSSSVTHMTTSFSSGSTMFGDTPADDIHQFTGSLRVTGSGDHYITDGNVGIGTTAPNASLHVDSTGAAMILKRTNSTYGTTLQWHNSIGAEWEIKNSANQGNTGELNFRAWDGSAFQSKVVFAENGNVGIGTTAPRGKTHILSGSLNANVSLNENTDTFVVERSDNVGITMVKPDGKSGRITWASPSSDAHAEIQSGQDGGSFNFNNYENNSYIRFNLGATPTNIMHISSSGNVGIGTTSPGLYTGISGTSARYVSVVGTAASTLELGRDAATNGYAVGRVQFVNTNNADASNADADGKGIAYISSHVVTSDSNAGDDSGGDLRFITKPEGGTWAERIRITHDGKVGIGTTAPATHLHISSSTNSVDYDIVRLSNTVKNRALNFGLFGGNPMIQSTLTDDSGTTLAINPDGGNVGVGLHNAGAKLVVSQSAAADIVNVFDGTTEVFTILDGGNVGIGNASPHRKLDVMDNATGITYPLRIYNDSATNATHGVGIQFGCDSYGADGVGDEGKGALVYELSTSYARGKFHFLQNTDANRGGAVLADSVFTIQNDGKVGIGTTAPAARLAVLGATGTVLRLDNEATAHAQNPHIELRAGPGGSVYGDNWIRFVDFGESKSWALGQDDDENIFSLTYAASKTAAPTSSPYLAVKEDGNVGIGTTSPEARLHVSASSTGGSDTDLMITNLNTTAQFHRGLTILHPNISNTHTGLILFGNAQSSGNSGHMSFVNNGSDGSESIRWGIYSKDDLMTLTGAGKVGIGTTSPSDELQIKGATPYINLKSNSDNVAMGLALQENSGAYMGYFDYSGSAMRILANHSRDIQFVTSNGTVHIEGSNGKVGIGTTSPEQKIHIGTAGSGVIKLALEWSDSNAATSGEAYSTIYTSGQGASYPFNGRGNLVLQPRQTDSNGYGDLVVMTGATATPKFVVQSGGNVGIGIDNPSALLTIEKSVASADVGMRLMNSSATTGADAKLYIGTNGSGGDPKIAFTSGGGDFVMGIDNSDSDKFKIARSNDEVATNTAVTIDSSGNVGIGTDNPTSKLHVYSSTADTDGVANIQNAMQNNYENLKLQTATDHDAILSFKSGNSTTYWAGFGIDYSDSGKVKLQTDNLMTAGSNLMTWQRDGNVGIGTTSPGDFLHIEGASPTFGDQAGGTMLNIVDTTTPGVGTGGNMTFSCMVNRASGGNLQHAMAGIKGSRDGSGNDAYAGSLLFYTSRNGSQWTQALKLDSSQNATFGGDVLPSADNSKDLGSASYRWANIYSADLHLSNEETEGNEVDGTTGDWSIQEGEDDLYLLNRKNGKKYKFMLQEIE